jgi:hypothetical protein
LFFRDVTADVTCSSVFMQSLLLVSCLLCRNLVTALHILQYTWRIFTSLTGTMASGATLASVYTYMYIILLPNPSPSPHSFLYSVSYKLFMDSLKMCLQFNGLPILYIKYFAC